MHQSARCPDSYRRGHLRSKYTVVFRLRFPLCFYLHAGNNLLNRLDFDLLLNTLCATVRWSQSELLLLLRLTFIRTKIKLRQWI